MNGGTWKEKKDELTWGGILICESERAVFLGFIVSDYSSFFPSPSLTRCFLPTAASISGLFASCFGFII